MGNKTSASQIFPAKPSINLLGGHPFSGKIHSKSLTIVTTRHLLFHMRPSISKYLNSCYYSRCSNARRLPSVHRRGRVQRSTDEGRRRAKGPLGMRRTIIRDCRLAAVLIPDCHSEQSEESALRHPQLWNARRVTFSVRASLRPLSADHPAGLSLPPRLPPCCGAGHR